MHSFPTRDEMDDLTFDDLPNDIVRRILYRAELSIDTRLTFGVPPKRLALRPANKLKNMLRIRCAFMLAGRASAPARSTAAANT